MENKDTNFENLFEKMRAASNEDILNMVKELGTSNQNCPHCGHDKWMVSGDGHHFFSPMFIEKDALGVEIGSFTPMADVFCERCGFTKSFSLGRLILGYEKRNVAAKGE